MSETKIKNYTELSVKEQESFISHSGLELAQKLYYEHDIKGLEVLKQNMELLTSHIQDCLDCLEMLNKTGDVKTKIYLLLDYLCRDGVTEDIADALSDMSERAQEYLSEEAGARLNSTDCLNILRNFNEIIDRNAAEALEDEAEIRPLTMKKAPAEFRDVLGLRQLMSNPDKVPEVVNE